MMLYNHPAHAASWNPDGDALDRYLAGQSDATELAQMERWLREHPESQVILADVQQAARLAAPVGPDQNGLEGVRRALHARMQASGAGARSMTVLGHSKPMPGVGRHRGRLLAVPFGGVRLRMASGVAMTILVALAAIGFYRLRPIYAGGGIPSQSFATASGESAAITLPDGSRVTLAPHSTLQIPRGFAGRTRTVVLAGEAYFDIPQSDGVPFIVQSGAVQTRVLGTAFGVRHYPEDAEVRVAVASGKVAITIPGHQAARTLDSGAVGYASDSAMMVTRPATVTEFTGWVQGNLVFRQTAVRRVIADLARAYGIEIRVTDSILAVQPVTLTVRVKTQSLAEVLDLLGAVLEAHWIRTERGVVLMPGRMASRPVHSPLQPGESFYGR